MMKEAWFAFGSYSCSHGALLGTNPVFEPFVFLWPSLWDPVKIFPFWASFAAVSLSALKRGLLVTKRHTGSKVNLIYKVHLYMDQIPSLKSSPIRLLDVGQIATVYRVLFQMRWTQHGRVFWWRPEASKQAIIMRCATSQYNYTLIAGGMLRQDTSCVQ